ncbi:MAG: uracil-DNA glycosylase family protein [Bacteroidota bacterium]
MAASIVTLQQQLRTCTHCEPHLSLGANPIFSFSKNSKIALISQAPGILAHEKSVPYKDPSGRRLRDWLDVDEATFYDPDNFAILPMGFCYPGKGKSGDLPPRKECAPLWHHRIWDVLDNIQLKIVIGQYAQRAYLPNQKRNLTLSVQAYKEYLPQFFPLVHPSPRNRFWLAKNPWFEEEVIPDLREMVNGILLK